MKLSLYLLGAKDLFYMLNLLLPLYLQKQQKDNNNNNNGGEDGDKGENSEWDRGYGDEGIFLAHWLEVFQSYWDYFRDMVVTCFWNDI